jgi:hypothetical protein
MNKLKEIKNLNKIMNININIINKCYLITFIYLLVKILKNI